MALIRFHILNVSEAGEVFRLQFPLRQLASEVNLDAEDDHKSNSSFYKLVVKNIAKGKV